MIRVFHIIGHFDVGGAERVAVNIAKSKNPNYEYHVVELLRAHSKFTSAFIKELEDSHIKYHRGIVPIIPSHYIVDRFAAITFPLWFIFLYLKYRPQVIHTHTEMPDLAVYTFFKFFPNLLRRVKIVRTIHNTQLWSGMKRTGEKVEKWMQEQNANVSISPSVSKEYLKNYHQSAPIILNGVSPVEQKRYENLIPDKMNILFAGRFEEQKGIATLAATVKAMATDNRFFFHIAGSGRLNNYIRKELAECNNCSIIPPIYGLSTYMHCFDFLFMPSLFEGLVLSSIEASMNGLPVVANDCDGLRDTLPPDWPLKVKNNDVASYVKIFTGTSAASRSYLANVAKEFVTSRFSIKNMQKQYEHIYSETKDFSL